MLVPEAAPNVNNAFQARKDDIWLARQRLDMQPVPEAHPMDQPAHDHLWRGIPASNPAHIRRPAFRREVVHDPSPLVRLLGPSRQVMKTTNSPAVFLNAVTDSRAIPCHTFPAESSRDRVRVARTA